MVTEKKGKKKITKPKFTVYYPCVYGGQALFTFIQYKFSFPCVFQLVSGYCRLKETFRLSGACQFLFFVLSL